MTVDKIVQSLESNLAAFAGLGYKVAFDLGEDGVLAIDATSSPAALTDARRTGETFPRQPGDTFLNE